jgi:RND family efflux transporter MFP subunit
MAGCSTDQKVAADAPEVVRNVDVAVATTASVPDVLEAVGTVRAFETSQLSSQVMGTLVVVRVREGDRIRRGEVLAVIDDAAAKAALERASAAELASGQELAAAESDLALAESTLARYQILFDKQIISRQQFDETKARQQAALAHRDLAQAGQAQTKAAVTEARTAFAYTRIQAPFDGVVTERKLDPGAMANPGLPILVVEDTGKYRLEATVNESDLRYVRLGQQVPVVVEALERPEQKGRVAQIIPAADPGSRSFLVKIEIPATANMRSGLFGRALFSRGEKPALLIPQSAVVQRGQLRAIYAIDQNKIASLRYVTLGRAAGMQVEVLAGIQNGDSVVQSPGQVDLGGKRIEARP